MRRALLLLAGLMVLAGTAYGQDTPIGEFSANYSSFRAGGYGGANLHGGSISGAGNVNSWLGIAGDYGVYHFQPSFSGGINIHTFTVGPRLSFREYMMLRVQGDTLNCTRVSAGIVFRFGEP